MKLLHALLLLVLSNILGVTSIRRILHAETWECPSGYTMMLGKCYRVFTKKETRMAAELACQAEGNGGTLAKPTTLTHVSQNAREFCN